jgi:hypothetical protein
VVVVVEKEVVVVDVAELDEKPPEMDLFTGGKVTNGGSVPTGVVDE